MLDKLKDRQFPVTKGGSGQRAESLQQLTRQVASLPNEFGRDAENVVEASKEIAHIVYYCDFGTCYIFSRLPVTKKNPPSYAQHPNGPN